MGEVTGKEADVYELVVAERDAAIKVVLALRQYKQIRQDYEAAAAPNVAHADLRDSLRKRRDVAWEELDHALMRYETFLYEQ